MNAFIRFSATILTVLALFAGTSASLAQAAGPARHAETTQDGDYFGFDLRTEQNVSLAQCENVCVADASCRAFTYNPKVKWCFLKSDFNTLNTFAGAIAGKIVDNAAGGADLGAPPALAFVTEQMLADALTAKQGLQLVEDQASQGRNGLIAAGRRQALAGDTMSAVKSFNGALAIDPEDGTAWLALAQAANQVSGNTDFVTQAANAALNAYQLSRTATERAASLAALATALTNSENFRGALDAYKASLALDDVAAIRTVFEDLKQRQGFRVTGNTIDSDSATPRACIQFSEPLIKAGTDYAPFVTVDGAPPKGMEAKDSQICVEGLEHGQRYKVGLRAGLPSSIADEPLQADVNLDVFIQDRAASVRFTGDSFVLPSTARRGIPIVSVNTQSANLKLYRIGDRNIVSLLTSSQFLTQIDSYSADSIETEKGELVWQGSIDMASDLNKEVVTSFPVDEALPKRKPGVYVLTAVSATGHLEDWDSRATQWFVVSDIGLSTYAGTDGLTVFTRSLASAKQMAGVELTLLAKNNEILGTATTDAEGRAVFTAGLLRGTAAMTPAIITAKAGDDDYVFLDMTRAGFDLSDRGVTGRAAPGAIDVLTWTERGIYRAGETVHVAALARDVDAKAIDTLPLTFIFSRPDGVEDRRMVSEGGKLGGYAVDLPLQDAAMRGTWMVRVYTDPKAEAISERQFQVDDFVPDRIEFDMTSAATDIQVGTPASISIDGRFLYGAPAAGLEMEGDVSLKPTRQTDAFKGYFFGLADEEATEDSRVPLEGLVPLDENGKAAVDVTLSDVPVTTQLLTATVAIRLQEAGGRAVERTLVLPVKPEGETIGIKPEFDGDLSENSIGKFHVISVGADGGKQAARGLAWKLLSVERNYQWYRDGSSWRFEPVLSTKQVATGTLDVSAEGGELAIPPVSWGRYRLEVASAAVDGPTSSVEFDSGWYVQATSTETPDALEIALDKQSYAIGETAKVNISPRFAGEVLITVGSETLVATKTATIPAAGGEVDIPVTAEFGAGAYVTATLYRPGDAQESRMPMRAIGIKWLTVDPAERKLAVAIDLPEKTLPRQTLNIPVSVTGAGANEEAYVTVAAVDVGILNLTRYEVPNPDGWYFGQRQLGLEIRDLYGRLIDGSLGATGRLRTGGDGGEMALQGRPPTEKLVAFFSGPVQLDAAGKAIISFDIPQFNGTARVMAVAWSKAGVGHATKDIVIRDPVVVTASMPQFLAPGDKSEMRLDIANTDGPSGDLSLKITTSTAITIEKALAEQTFSVKPGEKFDLTLPLEAVHPGDGAVSIVVSSADGLSLQQDLSLPVRPAALPLTTRHPVTLQPNASLTIDGQLLAESMLPGASVSINVSRAQGFDIPALLMGLDRYPLGCAEQTTSRALPLLYLSELSRQSGLIDDPDVHGRVQDAIYRVLSYQSSAGSFGLWAPGSGDLWLDAYVTDFLTRARELKYDVPEQAMVQALDNLRNSVGYDTTITDRGNEVAYALYVLARNRKAAISDLRYYADTKIDDFVTPLSRGHLAAAMALYGDAQRSQSIFADALSMSAGTVTPNVARSDYGSALRDDAAVLTLAAESRPVPTIVPQLSKIVAREFDNQSYTSTQEQMWMLLAARAVQNGDDGLKLDINGSAHSGGYAARVTGDDLLQQPVVIANRSSTPISAVVTTVAAPALPLPAGGNGFTIERAYYTLDGEEANVSQAQQNERYVVVITVTEQNDWTSHTVITDLLPAGFAIDNPALVDSAKLSNFDWIGEVQAAHTEFRSDRFVAAFDRAPGDTRSASVAYVVRAVTPGTYDQPAAVVEDMYRPQLSARTATGRLEVVAAP